jgi:hypothetical protein
MVRGRNVGVWVGVDGFDWCRLGFLECRAWWGDVSC